MRTEATEFDVIIVGGGMVGASLAVALAPLPLQIAVIEAFDPRQRGVSQPSYDDRSTAIANGSQQILETIGVWAGMAQEATAISDIHISDRGHFGIGRISAVEEKVPALGYVVPNRAIGRSLWAALESFDNIRMFCPARLESLLDRADSVQVGLTGEDGNTIELHGRLVAAADGAQSVVRKILGIDATVWDYGQTAIISNVTTEKPHRNVAYERFTANGPMAVLPMTEGRSALVWTVPSEQAEEILQLSDRQILDRLQELFGYRLGHWQKIGKRVSYPLSMSKAKQQTRHRVAIIGNAAHGLHPIAGQGFNLSLRDVAGLAEVIAGANDPGDPQALEKYRRWRAADQARVMSFTDALVRVFANPLASVRVVRNLALLMFDLLPGAKSLLARHTMGRGGDLPRLARGVPLQ
ncbi:MAG: 2-octaprenyl-6-methoxyphenyl hydroxylase [Proteobacteria bacterium]|nr:2-octaprenyl-6-methoxyphenyl hydroxylase [Pseudomonadota bacterium]